MTLNDLYLLSPQLSLVLLGLLLVLLDLVVEKKGALGILAAVGLVVPVALSINLWGLVSAAPSGQVVAIFNTLLVDRFSLFFNFLILGITFLVVLASLDYVSRFQGFQGEYYALVLFSASGMMLLGATGELISIYIALELTTIPLAALAAFLRDARSSEAGVKLLLVGAMSSALLLYGMALTFGFTGSTFLKDIAAAIGQAVLKEDLPFGNYALLLGVVLMVAGFGFKISSVPFQMWVPDVYEGAPTPITAFLSVASKAAGFAVILRVFYIALGGLSVDWGILFAVLSALSMTVGNLVAIAQSNIKRMLGYSTIAHAGYIMIGLAAIAEAAPGGKTLGPSGVLFYLGTYAFTNLAAFFAVIAISNRIGSEVIDHYAGMGRRAPFLALALTLAMISLTGIPLTAGFMGKLYIFYAAVQSRLVWLVLVGVVNSVISAYYYLRVVKVMYLSPPPSEERVSSSGGVGLALGLSALGIVLLGILPAPLLRVAQTAVSVLLLP